MRPLRLQLKNFMSYKNADLDLSSISLAVIVGSNGAGKSSVLQAITYCLWGQVRSGHNDVVRRGTTSCAVVLDFSIGEEKYRCVRRRNLSGKGSTDLEFSCGNNPLTMPTIKDTQALIDRTIGLSYDVFASSSLLQQGDADRFSRARPGERKELLAEMLGLGWFQAVELVARRMVADIGLELQVETIGLDGAMTELDKLPPDPDIAFLRSKIEFLGSEISINENRLKDFRDALKELNDLVARKNNLLDRQSVLQETGVDLGRDIALLADEESSLLPWLGREEEIYQKKERVKCLEADELEFASMAIEASRFMALCNQDRMFDLDMSLSSEGEREFELNQECESLASELSGLKGDILKAQEDRDKMLQVHSGMIGEIDSITGVYQERKKSRERLEGKGVCFTCHQRIEDPATLLAVLDQELAEMSDNLEARKSHVEMVVAKLKEMGDALAGMQDFEKMLDAKHRRKEQELSVLREKLRKLNEDHTKALEASNRLSQIDYDPEKHSTLKEAVKAASTQAESLLAQFQASTKRLAKVQEDLAGKKERLASNTLFLKEIVEELEVVTGAIANSEPGPILESLISDTESEVNGRKEQVGVFQTELALAEVTISRRKELVTKIETAKSKIGLLSQKEDTAKILVRGASKTGAQALLIEAALPALEKDANGFLGVMANGMQLRLMSQRVTLAGNASETLDILIYADGLEAPIETLSGGERFRADLAIRLAIGKMLQRKSGSKIEMLAIDEGLGSQDADGQEAIVSAVVSLANLFSLILVISHIKEVANSMATVGNVIEVRKSGSESVLCIS